MDVMTYLKEKKHSFKKALYMFHLQQHLSILTFFLGLR